MPRLLVGYTELDGSKLKKGRGFLKPNFGVGPNWLCPGVGHSSLRKPGEARIELYTKRIERHRNGMVLPDSKHKVHQLLCRVVLAE